MLCVLLLSVRKSRFFCFSTIPYL